MFFNNIAPDEVGASLDAMSAGLKLPALVSTTELIRDVINGQPSKIREKTIDDAVDCLIDMRKASIKSSYLSREDKDMAINESEVGGLLLNMMFKAVLSMICDLSRIPCMGSFPQTSLFVLFFGRPAESYKALL